MLVCKTISEIRESVNIRKKDGKSIGFVPTMGALHKGHLTLVEESIANSDVTVVSIFVNPIQFNNQEDFDKYPDTLEEDLDALKDNNVDIVFLPEVSEMYVKAQGQVTINFGMLEEVLEGEFRPGHFSGVGVVVSKLFNVVNPDIAFFGQKDLQQLAVIKTMVAVLNFNVQIIGVPTVREVNGLAMSSRNMRLTTEQRVDAGLIFDQLSILKAEVLEGTDFDIARNKSSDVFAKKGFDVEYLELVDSLSLESVKSITNKEVAICIAAHFGGVRLIDNLVFSPIKK